MDKKTLESYGKIKLEIGALEKRIKRLQTEQPQAEHVSVRGSNPEFPYQPMSFHFGGYNIKENEYRRQKVEQAVKRLQTKKEKLLALEDEIESFIDSIDDITLRLIFRYRYLDGLTQEQIGRILHMDRSNVSKKIDAYFKDSHNSHF